MELNSIIFPSPFMRDVTQFNDEIIYIPKIDFEGKAKKEESYLSSWSSSSDKKIKNDKETILKEFEQNKEEFISKNLLGHIPCLFLQSIKKNLISKNYLLYFHGNAEDIFYARDIADRMRNNLSVRF